MLILPDESQDLHLYDSRCMIKTKLIGSQYNESKNVGIVWLPACCYSTISLLHIDDFIPHCIDTMWDSQQLQSSVLVAGMILEPLVLHVA